MQRLSGSSPKNKNRVLDCWVDDEGRLALWIHSPDSDTNGWQIHVDPARLEETLGLLGVMGEAMTIRTVPDFFQDETEDALRSQMEWFGKEAGVDHSFFAGLLKINEADFESWLGGEDGLLGKRKQLLQGFWQMVLHLLSFLNFDRAKVRELFRHAPSAKEDTPLAPPWSGSTLTAFLKTGGAPAVEKVDRWVTGLRFGDPYAA